MNALPMTLEDAQTLMHTLSHDIQGDEEFIAMFLDNKRQSSENTYRSYKMELKLFLEFMGYPHITLDQVTFKMCLSYRNALKNAEQGYADATIARKLNVISSLYKFGVKIDYLKANPMAAVIKPKVPVTSQNRYLLKPEIDALLNTLKSHTRNYLIAVLLLTTGLRASELVHIKWGDFFMDAQGRIGLKVIRKRNKVGVVKIRTDVYALIVAYRAELGKNTSFESESQQTLFVNYQGAPLSDRYVRKMLKEAGVKSGIDKSISTHWLRHTSASLAINGGADIKTCMVSYGWEHMQTAQRYIHDMNQLEKTAVDFIDIL